MMSSSDRPQLKRWMMAAEDLGEKLCARFKGSKSPRSTRSTTEAVVTGVPRLVIEDVALAPGLSPSLWIWIPGEGGSSFSLPVSWHLAAAGFWFSRTRMEAKRALEVGVSPKRWGWGGSAAACTALSPLAVFAGSRGAGDALCTAELADSSEIRNANFSFSEALPSLLRA